MNIKEYHAYLNKGGAGTQKYSNTFTYYNGHRYHSKKEADYAEQLDWRLKAGDIKAWEKQVRIPIIVNDHKICSYILDFLVFHKDGTKEYIDIKGYKKGVAYSFFKIKKNLIKAIHNIDIQEL